MVAVDLEAVAANWRSYSRLAGPAECAAVIKADAYGLGAPAIARRLAEEGARTFFVATFEEGQEARAALGPGPLVYVLEGLHAPIEGFAAADLAPVLNSAAEAAAWAAAPPAARFGLHLDTGMNRLGLSEAEIGAAAATLSGRPPSLVMSHLACASDPADAMNQRQRARFAALSRAFPDAPRSLAASAGAALGPEFVFDLIRPGVGLYGDAGLDDPAAGPALRPTFALLAPILQVRTLNPGESVGYGATWRASAPAIVATVAAGYADGVLRALSGRGYGMLDGRRCPVRGRVSMDLVTLDVSAAGEAAEVGALVTLIGADAPLAEVARLAGTAPYELLTGLRGLPKRYGSAP